MDRTDLALRRDQPTIAWRATFEPIRRQLRRRHSWIDFADFVLIGDDAERVKAMVAEDIADGRLRQLVGNEVAQRVVSDSAARDFLAASRIEAAVSTDNLHMRVVAARLHRGEATVAYGGDALSILIPRVGELTWDDIAEVRRDRDLRSLRSVMADLESAAWDQYEIGTTLTDAVEAEYRALLERGRRHALSFGRAFQAAGLAAVVAIVTGVIPAIPAAAVAAAGALVAEWRGARRYESSWLAAMLDIKERADYGRPLSTSNA